MERIKTPLDERLAIEQDLAQRIMALFEESSFATVVPLTLHVARFPDRLEPPDLDELARPVSETRVQYYPLRPEQTAALLRCVGETIQRAMLWRRDDEHWTDVHRSHARAEAWRAVARKLGAALYLGRGDLRADSHLAGFVGYAMSLLTVVDGERDDRWTSRLEHLEREIEAFQAHATAVRRHYYWIGSEIASAKQALTSPGGPGIEGVKAALVSLEQAQFHLQAPDLTDSARPSVGDALPAPPKLAPLVLPPRLDDLRQHLKIANAALQGMPGSKSSIGKVTARNLEDALAIVAHWYQEAR